MKNIEQILDIISKNKCGITVKSILENIDSKINKTTIYRNLEKLLDNGEILEDFSENNEKTYSKKEIHHHHFICNKCGEKINIGCFFDSEILNLEKKFNFKVKNHSFILNGVCEKCL